MNFGFSQRCQQSKSFLNSQKLSKITPGSQADAEGCHVYIFSAFLYTYALMCIQNDQILAHQIKNPQSFELGVKVQPHTDATTKGEVKTPVVKSIA
jgi:hypothetical protein